jgi:hypothetical protein
VSTGGVVTTGGGDAGVWRGWVAVGVDDCGVVPVVDGAVYGV